MNLPELGVKFVIREFACAFFDSVSTSYIVLSEFKNDSGILRRVSTQNTQYILSTPLWVCTSHQILRNAIRRIRKAFHACRSLTWNPSKHIQEPTGVIVLGEL